MPISLCDNNRSLRFSVCMTSVVYTFLCFMSLKSRGGQKKTQVIETIKNPQD